MGTEYGAGIWLIVRDESQVGPVSLGVVSMRS